MKLDPIGQLFRDAWKLYRERLWLYVEIALPPVVFLGLANALNVWSAPEPSVAGSIAGFIGWVLSVVGSAAMLLALSRGERFGEAYRNGLRLFWPLLWVSILEGLAIVGGFVLLIVPGIILAIALAFSSYTLVLDGKRGFNALATSREYVRGHWWAVFVRGLLFGIAYAVAIGVVTAIFHAVNAMLGALAYAVVLLFALPYTYAYGYLLYENLKRVKPEAAAAAETAKRTFLKVCAIIGLVMIALLILLVALYAGLNGGSLPTTGGPMLPITTSGASLDPSAANVGDTVKVSFSGGLAQSNNVFMNDLIAAKNVPSTDGKTLTFTVPKVLGPYCGKGMMCAQFLLNVQSGSYVVSVGPADQGPSAAQSAGVLTVNGGAPLVPPTGGKTNPPGIY